MLKDKAREYYQNGYNCAEAMIRATNDEYGLGINEAGLQSYGGFGGGMQCGNVCGAFCGALGAISAREIDSCAHDSETLNQMCNEFLQAAQEHFDSLLCDDIKPRLFEEGKGCVRTVEQTAELLERVLDAK